MEQICVCLLCLVVFAQAKMEGNIVGGQQTKIENYPYSVYLNVNCIDRYKKKSSWMCGGSVVNQLIILTAGHCLHGCTYESSISVSIGNEHRRKGKNYAVNSFVVHEKYDPKTSDFDIGLVKVQRPLKLSGYTKRIALLKNPPYDEKANVAGWGIVDELNGFQGDMLKFVNQNVLSRQECLKIFRHLSKGTICAKADSAGDYASQGDSGSALVVRGYIQIGLVSYKIPTIARNIVVYTDVGYYYLWIKKYAEKLICQK